MVSQTPKMTNTLHEVKQRAKGKVLVSTRRYLWALPTLQSLLTSPAVFHTSLETAGDLVYVSFDLADLTSTAAARCVAVCNPGAPHRVVGSAKVRVKCAVFDAALRVALHPAASVICCIYCVWRARSIASW